MKIQVKIGPQFAEPPRKNVDHEPCHSSRGTLDTSRETCFLSAGKKKEKKSETSKTNSNTTHEGIPKKNSFSTPNTDWSFLGMNQHSPPCSVTCQPERSCKLLAALQTTPAASPCWCLCHSKKLLGPPLRGRFLLSVKTLQQSPYVSKMQLTLPIPCCFYGIPQDQSYNSLPPPVNLKWIHKHLCPKQLHSLKVTSDAAGWCHYIYPHSFLGTETNAQRHGWLQAMQPPPSATHQEHLGKPTLPCRPAHCRVLPQNKIDFSRLLMPLSQKCR